MTGPAWIHQTVAERAEHAGDDQDETLEYVDDAPRTSFTAAELMGMDFPEPRWAVPGVVPEGLAVFAGAPKVGKSWMALNLAVGVALGGKALGRVAVDAGDVLYLALEDTPRRLQQRLRMVLDGTPAPDRLTVSTECARFPDGIDRIDRWLQATPDARLVIVDVFAKVRPRQSDNTNAYLADYASVVPLKTLADQHGIAILLLHHVRKMGSEDFLETVSGTNGITGAADTIMVIKRARNTADAILSVTGRDVDESEHALKFDSRTGSWLMLPGSAAEYDLGTTRRDILAAVRGSEGIGPKAIAEVTGIEYATVKQTVRRMVDDDQLDTDGQGRYFARSTLSPLSPVSPPTGDGDSSDRSDTNTGGTDA